MTLRPLLAALLLTACTAPVGTVSGEDILLGQGTFFTYEVGDPAVRSLGLAFSDADDTCAAFTALQDAQFKVYQDGSLSFDERNEALGSAWESAFPIPSWYLTMTVQLEEGDDLDGSTYAPGVQGLTVMPGVFYGHLRHLLKPVNAQYFYDYNVQGQEAVADTLASYAATDGTLTVTLGDGGTTLTGEVDTGIETFGGGDKGTLAFSFDLEHCDAAAAVYTANP